MVASMTGVVCSELGNSGCRARGHRVVLAKVLDLGHGESIARHVKPRVQEHRNCRINVYSAVFYVLVLLASAVFYVLVLLATAE